MSPHSDRQQTKRLQRERLTRTTRRHFLSETPVGLAAIYLASQQAQATFATETSSLYRPLHDLGRPLSPVVPPLPTRVKRVIHLHMVGAPSQLELFDYKPELARLNGQPCPASLLEGKRFAFINGTPQMLGPLAKFSQHGQSGAWVSDHLPHLAKQVDRLCFVKTMQTDQFNHGPAQLMVQTGTAQIGSPSIGSWVTWGLGSENDDLPGFIVLLSGGRPPRVGKALWSGGFLPSVYQGVQCRSQGDPVLGVSNPEGVSRQHRRKMLDALADLNRGTHETFGDEETLTRIAQYEMAYRMQMAAPEAMDMSDETTATLDAYGAVPGSQSLANNCLLARRLIERGVRYVQLYDWGWDTHGDNEKGALNGGFRDKCRLMDRPVATLLADLAARGLLDETLVIWGGEFGRTPMRENRGGATMKFIGRDHSPSAFTFWMAGAGVRPGMTYGRTDPVGYNVAENPVHLRDFHATLLTMLGMDPQRTAVPFKGLNQKLTGVKPAKVIREILA